MAVIVFSDGTQKTVAYNQAAKIYQILIGNDEPENEKQKLYCLRVANVIFDGSRTKSDFQTKLDEFKVKHQS